ncbi:MAG: ribonuclease P protein component [Pseudobdellovibrionaceae bacterium]
MRARHEDINRTSRLTRQAVFDCLRTTKTRWVSDAFALQAVPKTADSPPDIVSFCVITSKKTAKLATNRNHMRRRLRAVALEILPTCAAMGMDYMIVARHKADSRSYDDMKKDMIWCLKRLNLLREPHDA